MGKTYKESGFNVIIGYMKKLSLEKGGLGLGCWSYGGDGVNPPHDDKALAIIRNAPEQGIIHLDTAQDYGAGHSEEVIGRAVSGMRDRYFIASKAHQVNNAAQVIRLVEQSLERLRTDWLDLFYIHWPHSGMDLRPTMEGLETCRSRRLIRQIGVSNFSVENMEQASREGRIDVHQLGYSLLWRFAEADILPWCRERGVFTIAYSPIAQGLLSDRGTDLSRRSPEDPRSKTIYYRPDVWEWLRPLVEKMQDTAARTDLSLSQLALRWVLKASSVDGAVSGASSLAQLENHGECLNRNNDDTKAFAELLALSDEAMINMPDEGNIFQYHP